MRRCIGSALPSTLSGDRHYSEIRSWSPITELPNQPFAAKGVLDIRGNIVRVYDLARLVGGDSCSDDKGGQVVLVVSLKSQDVGLLVDTVSDIASVHGDDLRPLPASTTGERDTSVLGLVRSEDPLMLALTAPGDIVCRYGGDEFLILLRNSCGQSALAQAERCRQAIADLDIAPHLGQDASGNVTVSIGLTAIESDDQPGSLLARVDGCLGQAKEQGRNRVVFG